MLRWVSVLALLFSSSVYATAFDGRSEYNLNLSAGDHWRGGYRFYANNPTRHYIIGYQLKNGFQLQHRQVRPVNNGLIQKWYRITYTDWKNSFASFQPMLEYRDRESKTNNIRFRPRIGVHSKVTNDVTLFSTTDLHVFKNRGTATWRYDFARNRTGVKWKASKDLSYRLYLNSRWYEEFKYADSAFLTFDVGIKL